MVGASAFLCPKWLTIGPIPRHHVAASPHFARLRACLCRPSARQWALNSDPQAGFRLNTASLGLGSAEGLQGMRWHCAVEPHWYRPPPPAVLRLLTGNVPTESSNPERPDGTRGRSAGPNARNCVHRHACVPVAGFVCWLASRRERQKLALLGMAAFGPSEKRGRSQPLSTTSGILVHLSRLESRYRMLGSDFGRGGGDRELIRAQCDHPFPS